MKEERCSMTAPVRTPVAVPSGALVCFSWARFMAGSPPEFIAINSCGASIFFAPNTGARGSGAVANLGPCAVFAPDAGESLYGVEQLGCAQLQDRNCEAPRAPQTASQICPVSGRGR